MLAQIVVTRGSAGWIVITFDDKVTQDRIVCGSKEELLAALTAALEQLVPVEILKDKVQ